jgi:hypothetical protein
MWKAWAAQIEQMEPTTALWICLAVIVVACVTAFVLGDRAAQADNWTNYEPQSWDIW